jgi:hypothetical protein
MTDRTPRTEAGRTFAAELDSFFQRGHVTGCLMLDPYAEPRDCDCYRDLLDAGLDIETSPLGSSERLAAAIDPLYRIHEAREPDHAPRTSLSCVGCAILEALAADPALSDPDAERQRAIGEAVERLPHGCLLGQWDDESGWAVFSHDMEEVKGSGPTLPAAIAAALPAAQEPER